MMYNIIFMLVLLMLLIPAATGGSDFRPDPVFEHIRKYGGYAIDMTYVPAGKVPDRRLKKKGW